VRGFLLFSVKKAFTPFHNVLEIAAMKWINTRFPEQLYDQVTAAANAQERTFGAWLRVAAKEKLDRDSKKAAKK
jgi:hypothetical protein